MKTKDEKDMKISYVNIVEYCVFNEPAPFKGWRSYRIEYWPDDKIFAVKECHLWLPPNFDAYKLEEKINETISANAERGL
jgi:hypothetical protein